MAITIRKSQQTIKNPAYFVSPAAPPSGDDIQAFIIQQLDSETGAVNETLQLEGTNLPFQPFSAPVRQQISKSYYPGGPRNRTPVVQVLGQIDDDVTVRGRFKSTKIYDVSRRREPVLISSILERFVREGHPCRFQLGNWIKYGFISSTVPKYRTDSEIEWEITLIISGDRNPVTGAEGREAENTAARVFASDKFSDVEALVEAFELEIDELRHELDPVIPPIVFELEREIAENEEPPETYDVAGRFSLQKYIDALREKQPIGDIVAAAQKAYTAWTAGLSAYNQTFNEIQAFVNEVDRTADKISSTLLFLENQRSRVYKIQTDLFSSYQDVKDSFPTFSKLNTWKNIGLISSALTDIQNSIKEAEDATRAAQVNAIRETYTARPGDTWQSIASHVLGSHDRWEEIKNLNRQTSGGDPIPRETILIPR